MKQITPNPKTTKTTTKLKTNTMTSQDLVELTPPIEPQYSIFVDQTPPKLMTAPKPTQQTTKENRKIPSLTEPTWPTNLNMITQIFELMDIKLAQTEIKQFSLLEVAIMKQSFVHPPV